MSLIEPLIKYLDRKFALLEKRHIEVIEQQNRFLKDLIGFLEHGPEFREIEMGSAEDDKIDDSVGEYALDQQAKDSILEEWRQRGYPDDILETLKREG